MSKQIILNDEVRQGEREGWVKELLVSSFAIEWDNGDVSWHNYAEANKFEFWDPEACAFTPYEE